MRISGTWSTAVYAISRSTAVPTSTCCGHLAKRDRSQLRYERSGNHSRPQEYRLQYHVLYMRIKDHNLRTPSCTIAFRVSGFTQTSYTHPESHELYTQADGQ